MTLVSTTNRYGFLTQAIHWITAILVVWAWLIAGSWRGGGGGQSGGLFELHQSLGFAVFVLVLLRLIWRLFDGHAERPRMPGLMALASRLSHAALYLLLFAVPATAIVGRWLEGRAINIYLLGDIGPFIGTSRDLGEKILGAHQLLGTTLIWVAAIHAAAALFHHFVLRDRVLRRMLPVG